MSDTWSVSQHILNHLMKSEVDQASALVNQHIDREQNNPEFLYIAARTAREVRDLASAKALTQRLLGMAGNDPAVHELAYKIAYDEIDLETALRHVALGARLSPPHVWLKQLALQQVLESRQNDGWFEQLCQELLAAPQAPDDHWRTASLLVGGGYYDAARVFLERGQALLAKATNPQVHPDALANDIRAIDCLIAGEPITFAPRADAEWQQMLQYMQPCPHAPYNGPAATIIVTSHFSSKLTVNAAKAPPNTQLLAETLASFRQQAQLPTDWPMVVCFDAPQTPQPEAETAYMQGLQAICREYNATARTWRGAGLRRVFLDVMNTVTTPYYMMLEHDWICARPVEPLASVVNMMDKYGFVHQVRYPRHHNHINNTDWHLIPEHRVHELPLLAGTTYSNNPGITRTAKFKRDWMPLVVETGTFDMMNGGAGGLEESIFGHCFGLMRRWGIFANRAAQGIYLLGRPNDPPRLVHTGI